MLGDIMGMSPQGVDFKVKEGMPYVNRPGENGAREWLFDTVAILDWLSNRLVADDKADEGKLAKIRISVAEAGLKELDLTDRMGLTINIEDQIDPVMEVLAVVKSRMNALPGRTAQRLSVHTKEGASEVLRILKAEVDDAFTDANKLLLDMAAAIEKAVGPQP